MKVSVIIPMLNEEKSIGLVIDALPKNIHEVIVVDNGSRDDSIAVARSKGAKVVHEFRKGYGHACQMGIRTLDKPDVVVFLDGDYSDAPEELPKLVEPILNGQADFVLGSRVLGNWERGSIQPEVLWRNRIACFLIRLFYRKKYTDIGPFRAIRCTTLQQLQMHSVSHGWNVEMQIKAAKKRAHIVEVPVTYRARETQSTLGGSSQGSVSVTVNTFWSILRYLILN